MYHTRALTPADLGAAIRDARREKGWQQTELAAVLGVSRMTVSRLERVGSVSMDTAMQALAKLGREAVIVAKFGRVRDHRWLDRARLTCGSMVSTPPS
ncbi:MAG: helix-turn-helix transcriptional regulator [Actinomycetales bacterium]|nr:helix-turn-helix transcriptional regulator [Actinomycetales bacterium]